MKNIWQFLGLTQETIGRGRYFIVNIAVSFGLPIVISLLINPVVSLLEDVAIVLYPMVALWVVLIVFSLVVYVKTSIRRVRDIGIARSWWVLAIIPLVNIPFFIFLCLKKGGANRQHSLPWENPFKEQFKLFFLNELSKPFIIICFGVIVAGAVYAGSVASDFELFIQKFGFGWWGVIALVAVLLINLLIPLVKLCAKYVPIAIKTGGAQTKLTKANIQNMPAFQRYLLLIALGILIVLILILVRVR